MLGGLASDGYLTADALAHELAHLLGIVVLALQVHQLGDGRLHRTVVAADDAGLLEVVARVVASHLHAALQALANVDDHLAAPVGLLQGTDEPGALRGIAAAVGTHDDGPQARRVDDITHEVLAESREERQDEHVGVELVVHLQLSAVVGAMDELLMVADLHTGIGQMGVVERLEGIELVGALLRGAVAAHQVAVEVDAHLGHHRRAVLMVGSCHLDAGDEVLLAVGAQHADGQLAAGEDDGLRQVLEHKGEHAGRERHGVGAVEHHEAVIVGIAVGNGVGQLRPQPWRHVAGVDGRVELVGGNLRLELLQLGHATQQVLEVKGLQCSGLRVAVHADGPAGID